LRRFIAFVT